MGSVIDKEIKDKIKELKNQKIPTLDEIKNNNNVLLKKESKFEKKFNKNVRSQRNSKKGKK